MGKIRRVHERLVANHLDCRRDQRFAAFASDEDPARLDVPDYIVAYFLARLKFKIAASVELHWQWNCPIDQLGRIIQSPRKNQDTVSNKDELGGAKASPSGWQIANLKWQIRNF
jgi:hypothetical protein